MRVAFIPIAVREMLCKPGSVQAFNGLLRARSPRGRPEGP